MSAGQINLHLSVKALSKSLRDGEVAVRKPDLSLSLEVLSADNDNGLGEAFSPM
jgi:hypothetical protein